MRSADFARVAMLVVALVTAAIWVPLAAQDAHAPAANADADHGGDSHGSPVLEMSAKLLNFAILAGTLVYFGRSPIAQYLSGRGTQIRRDLVTAAEMRTSAALQLEAVEQRLSALPAELEALRRTGAAEVAAEEARIRALADTERGRLLQHMRREIDLHGRAAERDLVRLAADRAVSAATRAIERTMTDADHARLQERYVQIVGN